MTSPERTRRLRRTPGLRDLAREARVDARDLIYPLFCVEGRGVREPVASMPGVSRYSVDQLLEECVWLSAACTAGVRRGDQPAVPVIDWELDRFSGQLHVLFLDDKSTVEGDQLELDGASEWTVGV